MQCQSDRPFAFVVHGLWPQFENGFPSFCPINDRRPPDRQLVNSVLDIMPSRALVRHQWRKHGTCTRMSASRYFATTRLAFEKIVIPARYTAPSVDRRIAPDRLEADFIAVNAGLGGGAIAVTCDRRRLREVRVCLTKDLAYRPCRQVDSRGCRSHSVVLPAARKR
jgi:ribonuclease T2